MSTTGTTTEFYHLGSNDQFDEPGTQGTHRYVVVAASDLARISFRVLAPGLATARVRVQLRTDDAKAANKLGKTLLAKLPEHAWKQPDARQHRFSTIVYSEEALNDVVRRVLKIVAAQTAQDFDVNLQAPAELRDYAIDRAEWLALASLIERAKGIPGNWGARRWNMETLYKKLQPFRTDGPVR